jgi:hypothetical protein
MTYTYEDFIDRLEELYPGVKRKSLRRVVKEGLKGLLRYLRTGNDVIIKTLLPFEGYEHFWIKFYTPILDVGLQRYKASKDLEQRERIRPEIKKSNKKYKNKSLAAAKNNKARAKARRKVGAPKLYKEDMTEEEKLKAFMKRRKQLRATRKKKLKEQRQKEQQNGESTTTK